MWDTVQENSLHIAHDMPCPACHHATHHYLACDHCACVPPELPGM